MMRFTVSFTRVTRMGKTLKNRRIECNLVFNICFIFLPLMHVELMISHRNKLIRISETLRQWKLIQSTRICFYFAAARSRCVADTQTFKARAPAYPLRSPRMHAILCRIIFAIGCDAQSGLLTFYRLASARVRSRSVPTHMNLARIPLIIAVAPRYSPTLVRPRAHSHQLGISLGNGIA